MPTVTAAPPLSLSQISPMLLDERPIDMSAPEWLWQLKHDGYRGLAGVSQGIVELRTRNGAVATTWFPEVARELAKLRGALTVLDGEFVVLDELGRSDFERLHARARRRRLFPGADPVVFCAFDLLVEDGKSLMSQPLETRLARLSKLLRGLQGSVMVLGHFESTDAQTIFREAVLPLKLEGLVAKRKDSPYVPGIRSLDWVKVKRKGAIPPQRFKRS